MTDLYHNRELTDTQIATKAARGAMWSFLAHALNKGLSLLTLTILARLLLKEDFGLVAAALVAINMLSLFTDFGLGQALIQRRGDTKEAFNTVFTLNILIGLLLTFCAFILAPFAADYFGEPQLTPMIRWIGATFLINALGSVHIVWLKRNLAFHKKLIPDVGNILVKGGVSIIMAFQGFGVWSLIAGQLAGSAIAVILTWIFVPWRPRLAINWSLARSLFKFGISIMGLDALAILTENLSTIVIGKICGMALLGVYMLAYRLPEALLLSNLWVLAGVTLPAFSMMQDRPEKLEQGFLACVRLVGIVAMPLCLGMAVAADPIIRVFFGEQWLEAVPVLRILALCAWVYSIGFHVGDIYKAFGRPDILLKLSVIVILIELPALVIGAQYGLTGVATGLLIAIIVDTFLTLHFARRFFDTSISRLADELTSAFQSGMVLMVLSLICMNLTHGMHPAARLAIVSFFGAAGYLTVLWRLEKEFLLRLYRLIGGSR